MGLIKSLKRITSSKIEAFLSTTENLELVLPELLKEMKDKIRLAAQAEAKAKTAVRSTQRKLDEVEGRMSRFAKGAELAVEQGDEETAKEALKAQIQTEKEAKLQRKVLETSETALKNAQQVRIQLQTQWRDIEGKKDLIIARAQATKTHKAVTEMSTKQDISARSLLDHIAQFEAKLDEEEALIKIQQEETNPSRLPLEERLRELERQAEIEKRMEQLRKQNNPPRSLDQ